MRTERLCVNCKHYSGATRGLDRCSVNNVIGTDDHDRSCTYEREGGFVVAVITRTCGRGGRLWEPKP